MSRIGKRLIFIPPQVTVEVSADYRQVTVRGPLGQIDKTLPGAVLIKIQDGKIATQLPSRKSKWDYPLLGTTNALLNNWIKGVTEGFSKKLLLEGLGYKVLLKDRVLALHLGFSHVIDFPLPAGIEAKVDKNTILILSGIDKEKVGLIASQIRKFKKTEPYKGKGLRYANEVVRRKVGKTATTGAK